MSRYGIEVVEIKEDPGITAEDVVSQSEAADILGIKPPAIAQAMSRGSFTVVWDLDKEAGQRSARLLLRAEVEQAAAGRRARSRAPRRRAPVASDR